MIACVRQGGFTLIEIAVVLLILGVLTRGMMAPLVAREQAIRFERAQAELVLIKKSITAYVIRNGVLPCPLTTTGATSNPAITTNVCSVAQGYIPANELAMSGSTNPNGGLIDPWGRLYRYAISLNSDENRGRLNEPDWTSRGEPSRVGLRHLAASLQLCRTSSSSDCARSDLRANQLAYVVMSQGQDLTDTALQRENVDGDNVFVISEYSRHIEQPFDDLLIWASAQDVMYWMLRAAWLP